MKQQTKEPDKTNPEEFRVLSRHQYGTLKFIAHNHVSLSYLRVAHATTLGSLALRSYLMRLGPKETDYIVLTSKGEAALRHYDHASLNERSHEGELTERCQRLLKYSARTVSIAKSA